MTAVEIPNPYPELWDLPGSVQGAAHGSQVVVSSWREGIRSKAEFLTFVLNLRQVCLGFTDGGDDL